MDDVAAHDAAFAERGLGFESTPIKTEALSLMSQSRVDAHKALVSRAASVNATLRDRSTHRRSVRSWILSWTSPTRSVDSAAAVHQEGSRERVVPSGKSPCGLRIRT